MNIIKKYEFQIDKKSNGYVIWLNDETGCVLRICGIPRSVIFDGGEIKKFIDISLGV